MLFVFSEVKRLQSADDICKPLQKKRWTKRLQSARRRLFVFLRLQITEKINVRNTCFIISQIHEIKISQCLKYHKNQNQLNHKTRCSLSPTSLSMTLSLSTTKTSRLDQTPSPWSITAVGGGGGKASEGRHSPHLNTIYLNPPATDHHSPHSSLFLKDILPARGSSFAAGYDLPWRRRKSPASRREKERSAKVAGSRNRK